MHIIIGFSKGLCQRFGKILPIILCDGITNRHEYSKRTFDLFLVNHRKSHRTSFIKQKYLRETHSY